MLRSLALALGLMLPLTAFAATTAGEITLATGLATATSRDGSVRNITKGGNVYSGEFISTGPNSYLNIKFRDGGLMLLRPNTRFQIEQFEYASQSKPAEAPQAQQSKPAEASPQVPEATPELLAPKAAVSAPARQRAFFRLLKGGLRTVTGLIGHGNAGAYQLKTPTATIGIRGTDYQTWICDLACASDPVVSEALKSLFGADFDPTSAEIIGTIKGEIVVTNNETGDQSEVKSGQYILSTPQGDVVLSREPDFIARDRIPDPKKC